MSTIADLKPGMIGFGPLNGAGAKLLVDAGQALLGEGVRIGRLNIEHVFVVTAVVPDARYDMQRAYAVEAMPSGARGVMIGDRFTPEYAYVQLPEDYPGQSEDAAAIARAMIGTPYSFASYVALAAWKFGLKADRLEKWIDRRRPSAPVSGLTGNKPMSSDRRSLPREAICSVLADQSWALTGKQVMPEGTPHQCVTPGRLAMHLLEAYPGGWVWPS